MTYEDLAKRNSELQKKYNDLMVKYHAQVKKNEELSKRIRLIKKK